MKLKGANLVPAVLACLVGPSLLAQLKVTANAEEVAIGEELAVSATWTGAGPMPQLEWTLEPAWAGKLTLGAPGQATYTPSPFLLEAETITVRVRAVAGASSGDPAPEVKVSFQATHRRDSGKDKILGDQRGRTKVMEPHLGLLAGSPAEAGWSMGRGQAVRFRLLKHLVFAGDHPDPAIRGRWLALNWHGQAAVVGLDGQCADWSLTAEWMSEDGDTRRPLYGCSGIAIRPGSSGDAWEAAIAVGQLQRILGVDAKGKVSILAGRERSDGEGEPSLDGPIDKATFQDLGGVAYGLDGALYVAEKHAIRKIHQGQVTTLAGELRGEYPESMPIQDGQGTGASFSRLGAMAVDPGTGDLLVLDLNSVRRVTKEGVVSTLAGGMEEGFLDWHPAKAGETFGLQGKACFRGGGSIHVAGGKAYIADTMNNAVRILDLATGALKTLVGGGEQKGFQAGRIAAGKEVPGEVLATTPHPSKLAFDPEGHCLLALGPRMDEPSYIVELVLDPEDMPGPAAGAGRPDPGDGKAAGGLETKAEVVKVRSAAMGPARSQRGRLRMNPELLPAMNQI
jgi:hypothetical protein